ncbi:collagen alpha-1(XII) chain-like isoform X2 [Protopterus annectens]|uniref:collagen alpha-1(XII) chain-like isoform X2 n=1 Tax=Protopterus annectens TaxID=7888 RepID=UPI001CFB2CAF|nr:collagen alpha-1(XII) chain-like isoform X2 [Protopterus annectens]
MSALSPWSKTLLVACQLLLFNLLYSSPSIPEADNQQLIPDLEGDILFLTDSSGSVSHYEFAKVKEFMVRLLRPFYIGPNDVQVSIVHISTIPTLEFPFDRFRSNSDLLSAVKNMTQKMGDTNTGKALQYAKDTIFTDATGSRAGIPKVLVWVTDGISTDDILQPMNLLKDFGVHAFIVSTGRGNYVELSEAASQPTENHLYFVEVDDLPIILDELLDSIIEVIRTKRLRAYDITSRGFQLNWPPFFSDDAGYYVLKYYSATEPNRKISQNLPGSQTSLKVANLHPGTTYEVTLIPETNVGLMKPQTITVTTLKELIVPKSLSAYDITSSGFKIQWSPLFSTYPGSYVLEYYSVTDPQMKYTQKLSGDQTSLKVSNLYPGTSYEVTLIPKSDVVFITPQKITVTTLKEVIVPKSLRAYNITSSGFRLQWSPLFSTDAGYYVLEYYPTTDRQRKYTQKLSGDQTSLEVSNLYPGTSYEVTLIPHSNVVFIPEQKITVTTLKEVIVPKSLSAYNITSSGFRLQWSPLFSTYPGSYVLEIYSATDPQKKYTQNLSGDQTSLEVSNLYPGSSYEVTLIPQSNVVFIAPQKITVTTLKEMIVPKSLRAYNITSRGFRLQWSPLFSTDAGYYVLEYYPTTDRQRKYTQKLSGDQTSLEVSNLYPGTSYEVTLIPHSNVVFIPEQKITVTTLKEVMIPKSLSAYNITSSSFQLQWSPLFSTYPGSYVLEYYSATDYHWKYIQNLLGDQTSLKVSNLYPGSSYQVTLIPQSNVIFIAPQKITVTTLKDEVTPTQILISESKPHSFKVSWSPKLDSVSHYQVLYSPLRRGSAKSVIVGGSQNTTVLENLLPNTTYLVTVIAQYKSGLEKALSAKACTLEENSQIRHLHFQSMNPNSLQASWEQADGNVLGYKVRCRRQAGPPSLQSVAPQMNSVIVTGLAPGTANRICVTPVYSGQKGKALCKTTYIQPGPHGLQFHCLHCAGV